MTRTNRVLFFAALFIYAYALNVCQSDNDCTVQGCECLETVPGLSICAPNDVEPSSFLSELQKCKRCEKDSECDSLGCSEFSGPFRFCVSCYTDLLRKPVRKCTGIELDFCKKDTDCGGSCSCLKAPEGQSPLPFSTCMNTQQIRTAFTKCPSCTRDEDCPNSECLLNNPLLKRRICENCLPNKGDIKVLQCSNNGSSTVPTDTETPPADSNTTSTGTDSSSTTTDSSSNSTNTSSADANSTSTENSTSSEAPPCVSTAWLYRNGFADAAIRHGNSAPVLCIPGLPCGTHGHMLRDVDSNLVSYREACERRSDCTASAMPVSQLSHTFDWSNVLSSDGELSLTSLSVNPDSKTWSVSRITANVADGLNKVGLGFVCNAAALFSQRIGNMKIVGTFMESY